jgi:8-oxo-dGTP pyrophosphatase MutT (NUDIX family)
VPAAPLTPDVTIAAVDRLALGFAPYAWPFATTRRDDIAAHFERRRAATPAIWNGRVLLMRDATLADGALRGTFFEVAYAEFIAWRDWGFPDRDITNCFAMGALRASDGAYLLGVMGPHTAVPGRIYFPAGTPDLADVRGDTVDLGANVLREVAEETGLTEKDFSVAPHWRAAIQAGYMALMKRIDVPQPAEEVRRTILRHLAREAEPELSDIRIVRSPRDFDPAMPRFVIAYLTHVWAAGGA